jgi:hypothetical protein
MRPIVLIALLPLSLLARAPAEDGPTAQDINNSNNPLTPAIGVNLQDQYVASSCPNPHAFG